MRIEDEIKLDFRDVLIRPKRSVLSSRKDVDLKRFYRFKHSRYEYDGIPIMAANMDGVGTIKMAESLQEHNLFTCLIKSYNRDIENFDELRVNRDNYAVSTGTGDEDFRNLNTIITGIGAQFICIDIANGYSEHFGDFVEEVRNRWPDKTIIAGNVVTGDMTQELILRGADIVKVGIGPGCFAPGQKVKTDKGLKNIEDIKQGEKVLTHTGIYKTVTKTFKFDDKKSIVNVNGIKATPNHEFYVLHKKYRDIVTDDNIHQFAEWVKAKDLTQNYLLLKHK